MEGHSWGSRGKGAVGGNGGLSLAILIRSCKTTTAPAHKMGVGGHRQSGGLTRSGKISQALFGIWEEHVQKI